MGQARRGVQTRVEELVDVGMQGVLHAGRLKLGAMYAKGWSRDLRSNGVERHTSELGMGLRGTCYWYKSFGTH